MMRKSVLLLKNLTKEKAGNRILDHFFLEILSGEIVNLIGLEGSGKEEIYSILFGEEEADFGEVWFAGEKYAKGRNLPVEMADGIFFIGHEEFVIPDMTVAENMYIIEKINYFQFSVSKRKMEQQAKKILEQFHVEINPSEKAKKLSSYEGYVLRLMRAYVKRAKLIVIDDILDDCAYEWIGQIIEILEKFKQEGISILWLNSYPDAISEAADRTVLIRDGYGSYMFYRDEYNKERLIKALVRNEYGRKETEYPVRGEDFPRAGGSGMEAFCMKDVENEYFEKVNFFCRRGEILGIYDLQSQFSRELQQLLLGRRGYRGMIFVDGKRFKADREYKLVKSRVGVIDGTKYQSLIFKELSVQENIEIAAYGKTARAGCFINQRVKKYLDRTGKELCEHSRITRQPPYVSRRDAVQIIYSRWRLANPKVLFCFQPFLRLDAVTREQLSEIFMEFKGRGMGIILSSVRRSELTAVCDRILVVDGNRICREESREEFMGELSENFQ